MTRAGDASDLPVQPPLADLLASYLRRQANDFTAGLASAPVGEVVPFEAAPVQTVEPRLAWTEAGAALAFFHPEPVPQVGTVAPDWPGLVAVQEPAYALPFALGNYPQLVRQLRPLATAADLTLLRLKAPRPTPVPALTAWADQQTEWPQRLLAAGVLRLVGHLDASEALLSNAGQDMPAAASAAWTNEQAALLWHCGRAEEAAEQWRKLPDRVPVLFNRGMAALFLGHAAESRTWLSQARDRLPEAGAWHHLAGLYLALAEMRG